MSDTPARPSSERVAGISASLPAQLKGIVGRGDIVAALSARLERERFVTIVGAGGIGKTTVAVAMAERLTSSRRDGVLFADLAPIADPILLPNVLGAALGLPDRTEISIEDLIAGLRDKQMLIVLDNCEHIIAAAAEIAKGVLGAAPGVSILATSREPLSAEGEVVHRLAPLDIPPGAAPLTVADALTFSSVQLFAQRAAAIVDGFEITSAEVRIVADICDGLDGLPLAIELAASRVGTFGIGGLATLLDDRFKLVMRGPRTAAPRHQTLEATLDWSYGALADVERSVLRRLAVFASHFTFEQAGAIASGPDVTPAQVVDELANLVSKSLVVSCARYGGFGRMLMNAVSIARRSRWRSVLPAWRKAAAMPPDQSSPTG